MNVRIFGDGRLRGLWCTQGRSYWSEPTAKSKRQQHDSTNPRTTAGAALARLTLVLSKKPGIWSRDRVVPRRWEAFLQGRSHAVASPRIPIHAKTRQNSWFSLHSPLQYVWNTLLEIRRIEIMIGFDPKKCFRIWFKEIFFYFFKSQNLGSVSCHSFNFIEFE